ncbi:hypothetical protein PHYC_02469 [Phycisphaerales bacterium]|nr:hypothetical protein PHYC_02469 [Phycisphaerales bacterium]
MLKPLIIAALLAMASYSIAQPAPDAKPSLAGPAQPSEHGYHLAKGPFRVVTVEEVTLHDAARSKDLRVKVRAPAYKGDEPKDAPRFPLVVFSHGLGGSKDAFGDLCEHLASHGYVVINPTHADSIQERQRKGEKVTRDNAFDIRRMTPDARWDRVKDIGLILDSLDKIELDVDALHDAAGRGRVDRDRIAAAGHSAGALTTQLIGGMNSRDAENGEKGPQPDPRVKAAVVISGQGVNRFAIREDAWSKVAIPWLVITGSQDTTSISSETPATRRHPFEKARGREKGGPPAYLLWIEGATHSSYQGSGSLRTLRETPKTDVKVIQDCVASATLAFLDRYIKGQEGAEKYLTGEGIKSLSGGKAELKSK